MTILTTANTKIFVGGEFTGKFATDAATLTAYEALTWTEIGQVSDLGEFGDEASEITYETIGEGRVFKGKGVRDAGTVELKVAREATDAGQTIMRAAAASSKVYALKVELNDAPTGGTPTTLFMSVLVRSARNSFGSPDNVVETSFTSSITSKILEVPAEA